MTSYFHSVCPHCGKVNDLQTSDTQGRVPENGDISICAKCLKVAVFDDSALGGARKPTDQEWIEFSQDPDLSRGLKNLEAAKKLRDQKR